MVLRRSPVSHPGTLSLDVGFYQLLRYLREILPAACKQIGEVGRAFRCFLPGLPHVAFSILYFFLQNHGNGELTASANQPVQDSSSFRATLILGCGSGRGEEPSGEESSA